MTNFTLNVNFTSDQLNVIYASGSNVVLAKQNNSGPPNVTWAVFRPNIANKATWQDSYGLYDSTINLQAGVRINILSQLPKAEPGQSYTINNTGMITGPTGAGTPNQYVLNNDFTNAQQITAGLTQSLNINGQGFSNMPTCADTIFQQANRPFNASDIIYIWLQSNVISSSVLGPSTSPQTVLQFSNSQNQMTVSYDSNTGRFIPQANTANVEHIEPAL